MKLWEGSPPRRHLLRQCGRRPWRALLKRLLGEPLRSAFPERLIKAPSWSAFELRETLRASAWRACAELLRDALSKRLYKAPSRSALLEQRISRAPMQSAFAEHLRRAPFWGAFAESLTRAPPCSVFLERLLGRLLGSLSQRAFVKSLRVTIS